ncbi:MAG: hypothetical protein H7Y27_15035 [Gemmatimonadaceae bacterium]|nr:hypothetical protein [Chitinophagaceae bacterium]
MNSRLLYFGFSALVLIVIVSFTTRSRNNSIVSSSKKSTFNSRQKSTSFAYTDEGRIRSIQFRENEETNFVKTFDYKSDAATVREYLNDTLLKTESLELKDGLVTKSVITLMDDDGKESAVYVMHYSYNKAGQIQLITYGNKSYHEFTYDDHGDLEAEKWYNANGDIIASAKKQYFPPLPDDYTFFNKLGTGNSYGAFFPPFKDNNSRYSRLSLKVKDEITFDGRSAYVMSTEGYIRKGRMVAEL